jgi:hypothetical protein
MSFYVLNATDIAWPMVISMTVHETLLAGPATPTLEAPAPMFWPPGFALGCNKMTTRVVHRKKTLAQQGHDIGVALPHVSVPPDPLNVVATALSGRKVNFGSTKVLLEKQPAGAGMLTAWPPTPMTACSVPFGLPTGCAPFARLNTVVFGMSQSDYVLGWADIAATIVVGMVAGAAGKAVEAEFGKLGGHLVEGATKAALTYAAGYVRSKLVSGPQSYGGTMEYLGPYVTVSYGVQRDAQGQETRTAEARVGGVAGSVKRGPDGDTTASLTHVEQGTGRVAVIDDQGQRTELGTGWRDWGEPIGPAEPTT